MSKTRAPSVKRPSPRRTGPNRGPETMFRAAGDDLEDERDDLEDEGDLDGDDLDDDERDDLDADEGDRDHDPLDEARLSLESARKVADKHDPYRTRPDDMWRGYDHFRKTSARGRRRSSARDASLLELAGTGTRALTQLLTLWVDLLGPLVPPALRLSRDAPRRRPRRLEERDDRDERDEDDDPHAGPRGALSDELSIALEVKSRAPVRVSLELDRGIAPEPLRVRPLRATGSRAKPIKDAIVDVDGLDRVVVHVRVPDHTPPGTYEGAVLSADGRARLGRLRVVVRETPEEPGA